ncbi:MAG: DMT family transporter [Parvibaculaceae bacterium]
MARQITWLAPGSSLVIACFLWAAGTVMSKQLLGSVQPVLFLIIQLAPSAAILWLVILSKGARLPGGRTLLIVIVLGWLNPGLAYMLSMLGLVHATASVATLVWAAEPALIILLAALFLKEDVGFRLVGLTAAAALGVYFASGMATAGFSFDGQIYGAALILLGVLCCAIYTVTARDIAREFDPLAIIAIQQSTGLLWALCMWPFELETSAVSQLAKLSAIEMIGGLLSGLLYYALAFWFYLNGLRSMTASRAGTFFNLIPVFGIGLAFAFLGERLAPSQLLGALAILVSVLLLQISAARKDESQAGAAARRYVPPPNRLET